MQITISVPGKLMLFGEHAVVFGHNSLVTSVSQRLTTVVEFSNDDNLILTHKDISNDNYRKSIYELGDGEISKEARFVEISTKNFFQKIGKKKGVKISTQCPFSKKYGFGSSAGVTVGVIAGLAKLFEVPFGKKELFDLSYKTVLEVQGKGSGFDVAAAIYGGTIYFTTGGKIIEPLEVTRIPLIVAYSGIKADTVQMIEKVMKIDNREQIFQEIETITNKARDAMLTKNWEGLGSLMNLNQNLLVKLGVSIPKLDLMIKAANGAGAWGAKLSGAGGGDCMICIAPEEKKAQVEKAITDAGGEVVRVDTGVDGTRIES